MDFEVIGEIADQEVIAVGARIREVARLRRAYGAGRWRKMKGTAQVRLPGGSIHRAEVHWYEGLCTRNGTGRRLGVCPRPAGGAVLRFRGGRGCAGGRGTELP
jgi:hypothetical protein